MGRTRLVGWHISCDVLMHGMCRRVRGMCVACAWHVRGMCVAHACQVYACSPRLQLAKGFERVAFDRTEKDGLIRVRVRVRVRVSLNPILIGLKRLVSNK